MAVKYKVFVVPHTHWDRAWYVPYEEFRLRLVRLIDRLCKTLSKDPAFTTFCLDGQTIVLEDYLQIRPQMLDTLKKFVRAGRLWVGPWYILPDEFLVSPEALIRNLMLGQKIAAEFGRSMKVGYVPDPFGHIAQLPQILQGFDLDTFVFSRGIDAETTDLKLEFIWEALDGTSVLALHQRQFYNNAAFLGYRIVWGDTEMLEQDVELAMDQIHAACEKLQKDTHTGALLLNNGVDHSEHQPELPKLLKRASKRFPEYDFRIASFEDYAKAVKRELNGTRLQHKSGELYYDYGDMLHGVYSTRIYLKQRNRHAEDLLEKESEPLAAFAWLGADRPYPHDEIWYAWRMLLKNHPHDDICGCSVDQVHRDMEHRFDQVDIVGGQLAKESLRAIARNLDNTKQSGVPVMVFNPTGVARNEVMEINIDLTLADEPWKRFALFDEKGKEVPYALVDSERLFWMETLKGFDVQRHRVRLHLDLPPVGYRTLYVREGPPAKVEAGIKTGKRTAENACYKLSIADNGTVNLYDKGTRQRYRDLLLFEETEDCGDEYNWSYLPANSETITTKDAKARIKLLHEDALGATWRIVHSLRVPESLNVDRTARSKKKVTLTVETDLTCRADSPRVDVVTRIHNTAKDHRVRVHFPTRLKTNTVNVDGHFAVLERSIELPPKRALPPYPTQHQRRFASLREGAKGFATINDGLPELEVMNKGGKRTIALTLFRAVEWLSRNDYPTRPMHAGPPMKAPDGQCLRAMEFRYAFLAHAGDPVAVMNEALIHNIPTLVSRCDQHGGTDIRQLGMLQDEFMRQQPMVPIPREGGLPDHGNFVNIGSDRLRLSAVKKCETRNTLIVRLYNPLDKPVKSVLRTFRPIQRAWQVNMHEKREKVLRPAKGKLSFTCPAYRVMTFELSL